MKRAFFFMLLVFSMPVSAQPTQLPLSCDDFSWSDIEMLSRPYLDDFLLTALVMQGESSGYSVSAAAEQAVNRQMPEALQRLLRALIRANC